MKKTIRLTAMLLATITAAAACNKDIVEPVRPDVTDGTIRFATGLSCALTKTFTETSLAAMQSGGIKAAALYDDGSVMFNEKLVYDSGSSTYGAQDKKYYFPSTGTLSFYGVYPPTQAITVSNGKASLSYSHNCDTDLVTASAVHVSSQPTAVWMGFDHILSQASFTAKGDRDDIDYKIKSIKVTAADGGTYSFADDKWTLSGTTGDYPVISSDKTVGNTKTTVGSAMSFLPGAAKLSVAWECYSKGNGIKICEKNATVDITLTQGNHSTFNITFPGVAEEMILDVSLLNWTAEGGSLSFTKGVSATYSVSAVTNLILPEATLSAGAIVNVDWGDGLSETFQASSSKQVTFTHDYSSSFTGTVNFIVHSGTVDFGEVESDEFKKFSVNDGNKFLILEKIFVFTVNDSGKEVIFAPGNLYWDGSKFAFEEHQYDYPTSWNASHVGHFFWSKSKDVAIASSYKDRTASTSDKFFAADGGAIEGWTVLSKDEWDYIINNHIGKYNVSIDGKNCAVLVPDGVAASVVQSSYTAAQWTQAEQDYGLVALPFAGYRDGTILDSGGSEGFYWSGTPNSRSLGDAYYIDFCPVVFYVDLFDRTYGFSVRLVSVR